MIHPLHHRDDSRILRERLSALQGASERAARRPATGAKRQLVKVYDNGSMPSATDHFFACHPCEATGTESEGATPAFVCDDGVEVAVDFLRRVPAAGDYHVATLAGGRWVAEVGGSHDVLFRVECDNIRVNGATVTVTGTGGSVHGTSDSAGEVSLDISGIGGPGTYTVTATGGTPACTNPSYSGSLALVYADFHILTCCRNTTVSTAWCGCIAPGTNTVTIRSGACPGGSVVATGTADAGGNFAVNLPPGTYCASATFTAAGYSNTVATFTVPTVGSVAVATPIYPSQLTLSDSALGLSLTALPNVPNQSGVNFGPQEYWAHTTFSYPATNCCAGRSVTVWLGFACAGPNCGGPEFYVNVSTAPDPTSGASCPNDANTGFPAGVIRCVTGSLCYPLSLTATTGLPEGRGTNVPAISQLYGVGDGSHCLNNPGAPSSTTNTVTQ